MKNKISLRILISILIVFCSFFGVFNQAPKKVQAEETELLNMDELLQPVWAGEISYQESVLPVMGEGNTIMPIKLLYPIKEVIKVQNAALTITYQENVDYIIDNGELIVLKSGNIPLMLHREYYPGSGDKGFEAREGGYVCFSEGSYFHDRQIVVTYTHKAEYKGYIPEGKAHLLKNVHEKIANKEDINLFVFGDSISVGGNASGFLEVAPYMPTYSELFAEGLERTYDINVNIHNVSVGGKDSYWGRESVETLLNQTTDIDLAIVAFGMNDGGYSGTVYASNIKYIISKIQEKYMDADVLMVATMLPNYDAVKFYKNQEIFHTYLSELEAEGVALANMTSVHSSLLERKKYGDMTGNNVNHANDYLSRVYAQTLLATMSEKTENTQTNVDEKSDAFDIKNLLSSCNATASTSGMFILCLMATIKIYKKERKA